MNYDVDADTLFVRLESWEMPDPETGMTRGWTLDGLPVIFDYEHMVDPEQGLLRFDHPAILLGGLPGDDE